MARKNLEWWKQKFNRSSFFFIALFLHVVVLAMIATVIIFKPTFLSSPNFERYYMPPVGPPPPPPTPQVPAVTLKEPAPSAPVIVNPSSSHDFNFPTPGPTELVNPKELPRVQPSKIEAPKPNNLGPRLPLIRKLMEHIRPPENIGTIGSDVRNLVAKFPVYLAQYADGDWDCDNAWTDPNGMIAAGCLANLVHQIGLWSHGNLKVKNVKSIAIDSPELLSDSPPYIYFTSHKDFHLTDAEIENLQKYLQAGGAIWGDSAFAGDGSRFDVAFHREMKRVLPDVDANFEVLPMTHDIFTKSWFPIDKIPTGMNYRADPVEIINLDGKLAVIYTPNDYSDMMTLLLQAGADPPQMDRVSGAWPMRVGNALSYTLFTPAGFAESAPYFYRNYEPASAQDCYKLSMNILAHLLIRFDDVLQGI